MTSGLRSPPADEAHTERGCRRGTRDISNRVKRGGTIGLLIAGTVAILATAPAQTPGGRGDQAAGRGGGLGVKNPDLPANLFVAGSTIAHTNLRHEWVDIPAGNGKLHTWIEYPSGGGKAPQSIRSDKPSAYIADLYFHLKQCLRCLRGSGADDSLDHSEMQELIRRVCDAGELWTWRTGPLAAEFPPVALFFVENSEYRQKGDHKTRRNGRRPTLAPLRNKR
jgi:hypothetical protein